MSPLLSTTNSTKSEFSADILQTIIQTTFQDQQCQIAMFFKKIEWYQ